MNYVDPRTYGAVADGETDDTFALQASIDQAHDAGGGLVCLVGGCFRAATLFLKSNVTLEIGAGARLEAIPDPERYPFIEPGVRSRMDTVPWRAFLYAFDQENVTLRGSGEIDGLGGHEAFLVDLKGNDPRRPYGIHLVGCRNVRVEGLRLRNSAFWMLRCFSCDGVSLRDLTIWNHAGTRNNDGCDIDSCRNVTVSGCHIDSCDDALCLKSEGKAICEDVSLSNCVLASFASPLKFGTGSIGGFRNISVGNITIRPSACAHNHHVLGADGGLAGIDIGCVDGGNFENVAISNVVMRGPECPIFIMLGKRMSFNCHGGPWSDGPEPKEGRVDGLRISNLVARDVGPYPCVILGYPGNPVRGIALSDIRIVSAKAADAPIDWDAVDLDPESYPVTRALNSLTPAHGLYIAHAEDISLFNCELHPAEGDPRPALAFDHARNIRLRAVDARVDCGATAAFQSSACENIAWHDQP